MKVIYKAIGDEGRLYPREVWEDPIWIKVELPSGHELKIQKETGPIEEGDTVYISSSSGRLEVRPVSTNAILLKVLDW